MTRSLRFVLGWIAPVVLACSVSEPARADKSFADVVTQVNPRVVKVFGAGGFRGVTAYCTGVLVSPEGHILTAYSPTLDTSEIRIHLHNGRKVRCTKLATHPELDLAIIQVEKPEEFKGALALEYFDVDKSPTPEVGDWVLAFSNQFEIATRNEPVSVQRGTISAIVKLSARKGAAEAPYKGTAIIVDAITNNPGAHGGALTNRKGELIGIIGKELKNTHTETWVNYAIPINDKVREFVKQVRDKQFKPPDVAVEKIEDKKGVHGIILVPDVAERTPPYIEDVLPDSPAAKAGLKPDDLIVYIEVPDKDRPGQWEERNIFHWKTFRETLAPVAPGSVVKICVSRDNQLLKFELVLEHPPKPSENPK